MTSPHQTGVSEKTLGEIRERHAYAVTSERASTFRPTATYDIGVLLDAIDSLKGALRSAEEERDHYRSCYQRLSRASNTRQPLDLSRFSADRFWAQVDKTDGCWLWTGKRAATGYGIVRANGRDVGTHRVAYALENGSYDQSMFVLHRCDNPPCVNPAHLFLGTHADNMRDKILKGRHKAPRTTPQAQRTHCIQGHPFAGDNLVVSYAGKRRCRTCLNASARRSTQRKKESASPISLTEERKPNA